MLDYRRSVESGLMIQPGDNRWRGISAQYLPSWRADRVLAFPYH